MTGEHAAEGKEPGTDGFRDPRVDELLRRVAALEMRLDVMDERAAAPAEVNAPLLDRLATLKRDARAARDEVGAVEEADPYKTGVFEAIAEPMPDWMTEKKEDAPVVAPQMSAIYGNGGTYASSGAVYPPPREPEPARTPPVAPPIAPPVAASAVPVIAPPVAPPVARPAARPVARPPAAPKPAKPAVSFEWLVGAKGFMVVGSIVISIGVIMFLKLGLDRGWFTMPPAYKCLAAAGFGVLLLGAGELARRKINAWASAGLSGAGIATLYGAAFASYGMFRLVDAPVAFTMLACAAAVGVVVALRAGLLSVAILSLLGAYAAPMLARTENPSPLVMPAYLSALLALGLVLSAWRPRPFRALRAIVWWATVILGTWSVFHAADVGQPLVGIGFLAFVWAAVHAELWYGARRAPEASGPVESKGLTWRATRPVISTFATTMWCAAVGVWALKSIPGVSPVPEWFVTAGLAVAAGVLAMVLAGNLRVLIDTPETDAERIGAALMAQAGALIVATVVLGLAGRAEVIAGALLGLAAVFAGRWVKSRGMDVYGLIVLGLTTARLVVFDSWAGSITGPSSAGTMLLGLSVTDWTKLMCGAAGGWAAAGVLLVRSQERGVWRSLGVFSIGASLAVCSAAFLSPHADAASVITLFIALSLGALAIAHVLGSVGMAVYALAGLGAAVAELVLIEAQPGRALSPVKAGHMVLGLSITRWTGLMLQAAAAWAIAGGVFLRSTRIAGGSWRRGGVACIAIAMCVAFAGFVSPRAAEESLLVLGVLMCVSMFGAGTAMRSAGLTGLGVAALGAASIAALAFQFMRPEGAGWALRGGGLVLSRWGLVMVFAAVVWAGFAFALRHVWAAREAVFREVSVIAALFGAAMLFGAAFAPGAAFGSVVWVWLVVSVGLLAAHRFVRGMYFDMASLAGIGAATALWAVTYAFAGWSGSTRPVGLHPGLIQGLALAAAFAGSALVLRRWSGGRGAPTLPQSLATLAGVAVALVFVSTSLEVRRAAMMWVEGGAGQRAALSIWWGVFGMAMIVAGFWRGVPIVRHSGLALMAVAMGKVILLDMAHVPAGWRVASFLGLGLMMVAVGVGYAKAHARLNEGAVGEQIAEEQAVV